MIASRKLEDILQTNLNEFAGDQHRWMLAALSIFGKAAVSLLDSLEKSDRGVFWGGAFVTYRHLVDWNRQSGNGETQCTGLEVSESDILDRTTLLQRSDQYIIRQANRTILELLSQSNEYWIGFPAKCGGNNLNARMRSGSKRTSESLVHDSGDPVLRFVEDIGIPPVFLLYDWELGSIGGLAFRFLPLILDSVALRAYFPVEVEVVPFFEKHDIIGQLPRIADRSRNEWGEVFYRLDSWAGKQYGAASPIDSLLSALKYQPIESLSSSGAMPVLIDPTQLKEFADSLQERFLASMRKELMIVLSGHRSILQEGDVQPIRIGRSTNDLEEENTFKNVGDYWETSYQGKRTLLRDIAGAHYIAFLLAFPDRPFPIFELDAAVRHHEIGNASNLDEASSPNDEILDLRSKREYQARLQELAQERASAERDYDNARLSAIDEETLQIQDVLDAATRLGGRSRRANSQTERARVNITRQIKSAIKKIEKDNPALGSYLASTIKTGYACQYSPLPGTSITWNL